MDFQVLVARDSGKMLAGFARKNLAIEPINDLIQENKCVYRQRLLSLRRKLQHHVKSKRQVQLPWSSSLHPTQNACIVSTATELGICTHYIPNATQLSLWFLP